MQGYIIDIKNVRDEDLIVTILSKGHTYTTYRFYGARHSNLNIGYKIDFELESNLKSSISRLKDVLHLSSPWIFDKEKLYCWQRFLKLFYPHLKDIEIIDDFYFDLLNTLSHKLIKQNPKRAIIESYMLLLQHEGRLRGDYECFLCECDIEHGISLVRSFMPTHAKCSYSKAFDMEKTKELFEERTLVSFDDDEVEYLWNILLQGL